MSKRCIMQDVLCILACITILFKGKKVRILGFGWDKTENVLWRIYHGELDGYQAKNIFLLIGTNNLQSNTDQEVIDGIVAVANAIRERQPMLNFM